MELIWRDGFFGAFHFVLSWNWQFYRSQLIQYTWAKGYSFRMELIVLRQHKHKFNNMEITGTPIQLQCGDAFHTEDEYDNSNKQQQKMPQTSIWYGKLCSASGNFIRYFCCYSIFTCMCVHLFASNTKLSSKKEKKKNKQQKPLIIVILWDERNSKAKGCAFHSMFGGLYVDVVVVVCVVMVM